MKQALILVLVAATAIATTSAASLRVRRQLIPPEFRNVKIEDYLKNPRSVAFQLKCIVYDGPCDRIGKYLKVTIPELISGTCSQCTPSDRQIAGKLVSHIQKNFPKEWHDAVKKFQGGQVVKPEDASRLESLLGVKIESDLVGAAAPSEAPAAVAAAPAVVAAPAVTGPVAPEVAIPQVISAPVQAAAAPVAVAPVVSQPAVVAAPAAAEEAPVPTVMATVEA